MMEIKIKSDTTLALINELKIMYQNHNINNRLNVPGRGILGPAKRLNHNFIKNEKSNYAYLSKPYGWNKVHHFTIKCKLGNGRSIFNKALNFTDFKYIDTLFFVHYKHNFNVVDLPNLRKAGFSNCQGLLDVSWLSKLKILLLWECDKVSDISPLSNVRNIHIKHCRLIRDIRALDKVLHLRLEGLHLLHDLSIFKKKDQHIINCRQINLDDS